MILRDTRPELLNELQATRLALNRCGYRGAILARPLVFFQIRGGALAHSVYKASLDCKAVQISYLSLLFTSFCAACLSLWHDKVYFCILSAYGGNVYMP